MLELKERPDFDPEKTKALTRIAEESVSVEGELIALAAWIRENYGSTMIQALKTVLPVRDKVRGVERVTFVPARSEEEMQAYLTLCIRKNYRARVRLLKALKEEGSKKTVVLVSHRASTMRTADLVYEMESKRKS